MTEDSETMRRWSGLLLEDFERPSFFCRFLPLPVPWWKRALRRIGIMSQPPAPPARDLVRFDLSTVYPRLEGDDDLD